MTAKLPSVNCTSWRPHDGACLHQAAPRKIFFAQQCILNVPSADPRIPAGCALCTPYPKPKEDSLDIVHTTHVEPPIRGPVQRPEPPPGQIKREYVTGARKRNG